jgi:hypothetical protein
MKTLIDLADNVLLDREASKGSSDPKLKSLTVRSEWELRAALNERVTYENSTMTLGAALALLRDVDPGQRPDITITRENGSTFSLSDIEEMLSHHNIRALLKP